MRNAKPGYVVSARDPAGGGTVYFDGAGQWTADLRHAQIARSSAGRRALLRVAAALTEGASVVAPDLVEVAIPGGGLPAKPAARVAEPASRSCREFQPAPLAAE